VTSDTLPRVLERLRRQGIGWIWRRVVAEATAPSTRAGRRLHRLAHRLLVALRPLHRLTASDAADTLYAFYDTKVEPITFDVLWFIAGAEIERRRLGLRAIHFVIVPGPYKGVRQEDPVYEQVVNAAARRWRLNYLVAPCFTLLPDAFGYTLSVSRRQAARIRDGASHVYPASYEPALPIAHQSRDVLADLRDVSTPISLMSDLASQALVSRWLKPRTRGRKVVSLTLRRYGYMPERNSNLTAWADFARRLDNESYFPVLLLDTEAMFDPLPPILQGLEVFAEAVFNVGLRMALYEACYLNLGINNGPMALCWLSPTIRYLTFKMLTPSVPQSTEPFLRSRGFTPGACLPFAGPFQRWIWEDDELGVIEREFIEMVARIEADRTARDGQSHNSR
jgi:hypothetical protein